MSDDTQTDAVTLDPFLDVGETAEVTVLDVITDTHGRRWLIVEERRTALVLADTPGRLSPGDAARVRIDLAEALG